MIDDIQGESSPNGNLVSNESYRGATVKSDDPNVVDKDQGTITTNSGESDPRGNAAKTAK